VKRCRFRLRACANVAHFCYTVQAYVDPKWVFLTTSFICVSRDCALEVLINQLYLTARTSRERTDVLNFLLFHAFLMYIHYKRETVRSPSLSYHLTLHLYFYHHSCTHPPSPAKPPQTERRLYSLRDQLKVQFRATQKAQVNERKAMDSKMRLTSYVFHEVRVPLNTACE
jgi:hypothetical protein